MTSAAKELRRRLMPRTLFARSLMIVSLPILLLQVIVAYIFFDRHWDAMSDKLVFALAGEINMISDRLAAAEGSQQMLDIVTRAKSSLDIMVRVTNAEGVLEQSELSFQKFTWFSVAQKLQGQLAQKLGKPFAIRPYETDKWFEVVVRLDGKDVHFVCPDRRLYSPTAYIFILWLIGSAMVLLFIAMMFMRNQIRPIMRLAVAAEKFGKGQDVPDFAPSGASEVRRASKAFLEMKDRLKRQMEQRTAMLSGVSHDLRTPLTRMKLQLAMASHNPDTDNLRQDVEEMEKMVEGYLAFVRGEGNESVEMTDLRQVLDRIIANARRQGADVKDDISGRLTIKVRPVAVERAISNIVTNACKYAKHVWVAGRETEDNLEITVDDDGPGIPPDLREEVFKPFYRVEKSRNKKTGGVGLGLSIARDIVHSHGGEVLLEDSPHGGLRAVIRLPW
ncbi:MAG: HAMP domain-containing protein [Alphaproteobacteria bacterium]|nr:MAG: HAMP domain-containing protein [Alphaproteobacteria bacterium]